MNKFYESMELVKEEGRNISLLLHFQGFTGIFRLNYLDKTRKNTLYKDYQVIEAYFEQDYADLLLSKNCFRTHSVQNATDAMLWVERHKQYLLEEALRQNLFK